MQISVRFNMSFYLREENNNKKRTQFFFIHLWVWLSPIYPSTSFKFLWCSYINYFFLHFFFHFRRVLHAAAERNLKHAEDSQFLRISSTTPPSPPSIKHKDVTLYETKLYSINLKCIHTHNEQRSFFPKQAKEREMKQSPVTEM